MSQIPTFQSQVSIARPDTSGDQAIAGALGGIGKALGDFAIVQQESDNQRNSNELFTEYSERLAEVRDQSFSFQTPEDVESSYEKNSEELFTDITSRAINNKTSDAIKHRIAFTRIAMDSDVRTHARGLRRSRGEASLLSSIDLSLKNAARLELKRTGSSEGEIGKLESIIDSSVDITDARKIELKAGLDDRLERERRSLEVKADRAESEAIETATISANNALHKSSGIVREMVVSEGTIEEIGLAVDNQVAALELNPGVKVPGIFGLTRTPTKDDLAKLILAEPLELAATMGDIERFDALAAKMGKTDASGQSFIKKLRRQMIKPKNIISETKKNANKILGLFSNLDFNSTLMPQDRESRNEAYKQIRASGQSLAISADYFARSRGEMPSNLMRDLKAPFSDESFDLVSGMVGLESLSRWRPREAYNIATTVRGQSSNGFLSAVLNMRMAGGMSAEQMGTLNTVGAPVLFGNIDGEYFGDDVDKDIDIDYQLKSANDGAIILERHRKAFRDSASLSLTYNMIHGGKKDKEVSGQRSSIISYGTIGTQNFVPLDVPGRGRVLVDNRMVSQDFSASMAEAIKKVPGSMMMADTASLDRPSGRFVVPMISPRFGHPVAFFEYDPGNRVGKVIRPQDGQSYRNSATIVGGDARIEDIHPRSHLFNTPNTKGFESAFEKSPQIAQEMVDIALGRFKRIVGEDKPKTDRQKAIFDSMLDEIRLESKWPLIFPSVKEVKK